MFYDAKTLSPFSRPWCNFLPFLIFSFFHAKKWKWRWTHLLKVCLTSSWLASDLVTATQTESKQWNTSVLWSCFRTSRSANIRWPVPAAIIIHSWGLKLCLCSCSTYGIRVHAQAHASWSGPPEQRATWSIGDEAVQSKEACLKMRVCVY